jgi:hypothetical protein
MRIDGAGGALVDSEDICYTSYHVIWNVHILNTNHSSVISMDKGYDTKLNDAFPGSLQH